MVRSRSLVPSLCTAGSRRALRSAEAKVVVTTLQKFPFVVEEVAGLPERRYAVIVDEAHSSQTGEAAQEMKKALGGVKVELPEGGAGV